MNKKSGSKKNEKESLSTGKKLLAILMFSSFLVLFSICIGLCIKYLYLEIFLDDFIIFRNELLIFSLVSLVLCAITYTLYIILLRDYDQNKKEKNTRWYVDKILVSLIPIIIVSSIILISQSSKEDINFLFVIAIIMLMSIGIIITPNIVLYAISDMKNWKNIIYKNGSLTNNSKNSSFYRIDSPVSFERKILLAVIKNEFLNINTIFIVSLLLIIIALFSITNIHSVTSGDLVSAIFHAKAVRAEGFFFFVLIFLVSFWIPIFSYYITNAIHKIIIVKKHEYIVYHAFVKKVDTYKLYISDNGIHYKYDYCSCVGTKPKDVKNINAILVFIPDDVLLFPDI